MFKLRVQFGYPWKERVEINISISPNVTFAGNATDKEGHRYKIGGMLLPRTKGKYRVILTTLSWGWDVFGESFGTLAPDLELNRTVTVCSSDGIIHDCIATTLSLLTDEKAKP
ncbi:MAG: hypothetical protein J2P21_01840 [Chloracidobacterium sp.]|nr:hypothetical protein [Chloracidobacterium sp.]